MAEYLPDQVHDESNMHQRKGKLDCPYCKALFVLDPARENPQPKGTIEQTKKGKQWNSSKYEQSEKTEPLGGTPKRGAASRTTGN